MLEGMKNPGDLPPVIHHALILMAFFVITALVYKFVKDKLLPKVPLHEDDFIDQKSYGYGTRPNAPELTYPLTSTENYTFGVEDFVENADSIENQPMPKHTVLDLRKDREPNN